MRCHSPAHGGGGEGAGLTRNSMASNWANVRGHICHGTNRIVENPLNFEYFSEEGKKREKEIVFLSCFTLVRCSRKISRMMLLVVVAARFLDQITAREYFDWALVLK